MVAQGRGGSIVTMSSVNGITAIPSIAGYNASKGGVNNLTRWQVPGRAWMFVACSCVGDPTARQHLPPGTAPGSTQGSACSAATFTCCSMALALAPHKIRVNAVGPGSIRTDVLASGEGCRHCGASRASSQLEREQPVAGGVVQPREQQCAPARQSAVSGCPPAGPGPAGPALPGLPALHLPACSLDCTNCSGVVRMPGRLPARSGERQGGDEQGDVAHAHAAGGRAH